MRLKIKSDFFELWMSAFDSDGFEFRMMSNEGPTRVEMINCFKHAGMKTPLFGRYSDLARWHYPENRQVVVYSDITKHRGEGKYLKSFGRICCAEREAYMMEYIPYQLVGNSEYFSKSTRYLIVGDRCFTYDYYSLEDWRSNCGDGDITEPKEIEVPLWRYCIYYPIFAVDFVEDFAALGVGVPHGILKAIDLNIAPGVQGVGLNKLISSAEMVLQIKNWFRDVSNVKDLDKYEEK